MKEKYFFLHETMMVQLYCSHDVLLMETLKDANQTRGIFHYA